jgi:hypothetical protein
MQLPNASRADDMTVLVAALRRHSQQVNQNNNRCAIPPKAA